jgi:hypothetical protein
MHTLTSGTMKGGVFVSSTQSYYVGGTLSSFFSN